MLISSGNGLWRYELGDVVEFTSTDPYRIRVAGRTRQFINAFGEEVVMENAERAVPAAAEATGAVVSEYTAGPRYMTLHGRGAHEWIVEFGRAPESFDAFVQKLDGELMRLNSDYEAKRRSTMAPPEMHVVPQGVGGCAGDDGRTGCGGRRAGVAALAAVVSRVAGSGRSCTSRFV